MSVLRRESTAPYWRVFSLSARVPSERQAAWSRRRNAMRDLELFKILLIVGICAAAIVARYFWWKYRSEKPKPPDPRARRPQKPAVWPRRFFFLGKSYLSVIFPPWPKSAVFGMICT